MLRMLAGAEGEMRAVQAERTSYCGERRGAFNRETMAFKVDFLWREKVSVMSGKGGSHFVVVPRSPWVPTTASQEVREGTEGCKGEQMW